MIRVRYTPTASTAAPIIRVLLGHPDARPADYPETALLDCGAGRTVIPLSATSTLALPFMENRLIEVAGGAVVELPVYEVSIRIDGLLDFILEVVAADEPRVLLGRDVLNALHTHLNGPGRILTLSAQPLLPLSP